MSRFLTILVACAFESTVSAHFIFIAPDGRTQAKVVFSEDLKPDSAVPIDNIAKTKLKAHAGEKAAPIEMTKDKDCFVIEVPADCAAISGELQYGVMKRGEGKPYLLSYFPKLVRGDIQTAPKCGLPLEILAKGPGRFVLLLNGKPCPKSQVHVIVPEAKGPIDTDDNGEFTIESAKPGTYALRARAIVAGSGEVDGKKYEESRHFATLVFRVPEAKEEPTELPPLPKPVSSFGADAANGWLYAYGGHSGKTHTYSTETALGTFHRLNLADPKKWEELPGGQPLQGLTLTAHGGKLYRIGGMQPRNKPGEPMDMLSTASCQRFDPATGKWESLPDMPDARSSHDAVVIGEKIYIVGGWKMNGAGKKSEWFTTGYILDLSQATPKWSTFKQPFQRRALAAGNVNGKIYVLGGLTESDGTELLVDVYDPKSDQWSKGPKLPGTRRNGFSAGACLIKDRLYVSVADGSVLRLTDDGKSWEDVGDVKYPRIVHRMVAANGKLILVGGANKGENVGATEMMSVP